MLTYKTQYTKISKEKYVTPYVTDSSKFKCLKQLHIILEWKVYTYHR